MDESTLAEGTNDGRRVSRRGMSASLVKCSPNRGADVCVCMCAYVCMCVCMYGE